MGEQNKGVWGNEILDGGFLQVPLSLLRNYKAFGLTDSELCLALVVLSYKFSESDPWPSTATIARLMGKKPDAVFKASRSLKEKKMLLRYEKDGVTVWDFTGLTNMLLAIPSIKKDRGGYIKKDRGGISKKIDEVYVLKKIKNKKPDSPYLSLQKKVLEIPDLMELRTVGDDGRSVVLADVTALKWLSDRFRIRELEIRPNNLRLKNKWESIQVGWCGDLFKIAKRHKVGLMEIMHVHARMLKDEGSKGFAWRDQIRSPAKYLKIQESSGQDYFELIRDLYKGGV